MNPKRVLLLAAASLVLPLAALAQNPSQPSSQPTPSASQASFDKLKSLAGAWQGTLDGKPTHGKITLRVTSMGNTLMHEMKSEDTPDDPITMFTLDGDRLVLTHYCDAGNQPHMVATVSPDGNTYTFNFVNATNLLPSQEGHMQRVTFTFLDPDHHTEKWEFAMADGKQMGGLLDLHRSK